MRERITQSCFTEILGTDNFDVTPEDFGGILFPTRLHQEPPQLSRYVREAREVDNFNEPKDAAVYLQRYIYTPFQAFEQEEMWLLLLNPKNKITHEVMVYRGTINTVYVRVAEVLREAVRLNATAMIISHCHPSGDPTPSPEDVHMTKRTIEAGKLLDVEILDHIVIGDGTWVSMKERGVAFG